MNKAKGNYLGTAFRAAMLAGNYIYNNIDKISDSNIGIKQPSDFVTDIDKESERIIIKTIKEKYPDHHILAEESVKENITEGYRWIIDPLDGTTNFIHGYPMFSVSIALEHEGEIILGVVLDPVREELFSAEKDRGAFLNGNPLRVSVRKRLEDSLITTGFPFRKKEMIDPYLSLFKNVLYKASDLRRAGSAALDLAYLSSGRCEGFFEIGLSPWDIAAGALLIKEAGGKISDFGGGNDYLRTGNIVAGCPGIHDDLLSEVRDVFKGEIDS